MQTIKEIYKARQEIKKSTFLSFLVPYELFDKTYEELKLAHPKAVHIVWAYRHYNKYFQIVENQSDDGEPKGTSGPPALNSLRGANLINTGVFIVRYFGGIKLGTGGLVRAYSSSVNLAINEANLINFEMKDICSFFVPFALITRFEYFLDKEGLNSKKEFGIFGANIKILVNKNEFINLYNFSKPFFIEEFKFLSLPLFAKNLLNKEN